MIPHSNTGFWRVSVGNVVSWLIVAIGFVAWGQRLSDKVDHVDGRVDAQGKDLQEISRLGILNTVSQHERRIGELEHTAQTVSEIANDIKWIKQSMKSQQIREGVGPNSNGN